MQYNGSVRTKSNRADKRVALSFLWLGALLAAGCAVHLPATPDAQEVGVTLSTRRLAGAVHLPATPDAQEVTGPVVFGRAMVLVTGQTTRWYAPQVRFFELMNRTTHERFSVDVQSDDLVFMLQLPAGDYELSRVQISEGPFLSMADLSSTFTIDADRITYLGTWRFGVDTPRYGRMVVLWTVEDPQDRAAAEREVLAQYPALQGQRVETVLPVPSQAESRLYEVMPYPRSPRYFRRHWW